MPAEQRTFLIGARQIIETVHHQLFEIFQVDVNHAYTFWVLCTRLYSKLTAHALCGFVIIRYRSHLVTALLIQIMRHQGSVQEAFERVLVVGSGRTAEHIAWLLDHAAYSGKFRVVGFVDDDLMAKRMRIYGAKVIGACKDFPKLVEKYDIGLIILADHRIDIKEYCAIICVCDSSAARVVVVPDIFGSLNGLINQAPLIAMADIVSDRPDFHCQSYLAKYAPLQPEVQLEE